MLRYNYIHHLSGPGQHGLTALYLDARGTSWAAYYFDGTFPWLFDQFKTAHAGKPPYTDRYPELAQILEDSPDFPKGNRIIKNISFGGRWLDIHDRVRLADIVVRDNVIGDPEMGWHFISETEGLDPYYLNLKDRSKHRLVRPGDQPWSEELEGNGNVLSPQTQIPGGWLTGETFDAQDTVGAEIGFSPIQREKIGLYVDEFRS